MQKEQKWNLAEMWAVIVMKYDFDCMNAGAKNGSYNVIFIGK